MSYEDDTSPEQNKSHLDDVSRQESNEQQMLTVDLCDTYYYLVQVVACNF